MIWKKYSKTVNEDSPKFMTVDGFPPVMGYEGDGAHDIRAAESKVIPVGGQALIRTGLYVVIPRGYTGLLWTRGGMGAMSGLHVGAGHIDPNYRGEVIVVLRNHGNEPYYVIRGDKIAQLILVAVNTKPYIEVDTLDPTTRGDKKYGSSGQ